MATMTGKISIKVIINPVSGRQNGRQFVEEISTLLVEAQVLERMDIYYTAGRGDAESFALNTQSATYDFMLVVGGDGTVNEVVNGMMKGNVDIPLALFPGGTVNDFATYLDLPADPASYTRMLLNRHTIKTDVAHVGDAYFLNVLAGGVMTDIAYKVPSDSKALLGRMAYWIEGAMDFSANALQAFPIAVESETDSFEYNAMLFIVANTTNVGGIKKLLPKATICDGLLDVLIVSKIGMIDALPLLGQMLVGDHLRNDKVVYFQTDKITFRPLSSDTIRLDLDGEAGPSLPITIECIPRALSIIVPRDLLKTQNCPVKDKE